LGLVNDVLDISKIEAGKLELTSVDYGTADLLNDIITLNMIRIDSKPIKFIVELSGNIQRKLYGDELRVKQIFNNLLSNAFKYTKEGTVTLRVDCLSADENNIRVSASVSDTGIGIRQEDLKKLFSDYNQVDTKANRKIEGTGLGLSITRRLIQMMDGEITVESEYGKGSCFHIRFMQKVTESETLDPETVKKICNFRYADKKRHLSTGVDRPDLSHARVLVVDDYQANLDVAERMLRKYKMKVDCVSSGQAAVDLFRAGEPVYDAVFMDHMMPEMDGMEATQLIRGVDSDYARNIPIIALTANALAGNEQMFLDNGFNAFLPKPINILKLDEAVKKWMVSGHSRLPVREKQGAADHEGESGRGEIPGVNMNARDYLYSGDMEIYRFTLESFVKNTPSTIELLQNVTEETLPNYTINVHALKGMTAAIGAEDISGRAKKLEAMANAGDLQEIIAENSEFLKDVEILTANVKKWLSS
jgi:CheY-like chemotaxis protein